MKRLVLLVLAAGALLVPSAALASGVVIKVQRASHLVAVAQSKTKVSLVHTSSAAKLHVGQRVSMTARKLRNGTFSASNMRVVGRTHVVRFRGLLLAKSSGRYVVSAGGAVIALKRGGRTTASAADGGPAPGTTVDVTATVGTGDDLEDDSVTAVSADHPGGSIDGKLTLGTGSITVVSEHMALRIAVPSGFDLSKFQNGDEVLAVFAQQADGTLLLTSLSANGDAQQADQGDDDGGGQGGGQGGGDDGGGGGGDDGGSGAGSGGAPPPVVSIK